MGNSLAPISPSPGHDTASSRGEDVSGAGCGHRCEWVRREIGGVIDEAFPAGLSSSGCTVKPFAGGEVALKAEPTCE